MRAAVDVGVAGVLLKDAGTSDLVTALRAVVRGERVIDPRLGPHSDLALEPQLRAIHMTRREYQVINLAATGMTNAEIAERLELTHSTVKTYVQSALEKLGARNRIEAIVKAHEAHLL